MSDIPDGGGKMPAKLTDDPRQAERDAEFVKGQELGVSPPALWPPYNRFPEYDYVKVRQDREKPPPRPMTDTEQKVAQGVYSAIHCSGHKPGGEMWTDWSASALITIPSAYAGVVVDHLIRRAHEIRISGREGQIVVLQCKVDKDSMFGYADELKRLTQGAGQFTMSPRAD